MGKRKAFTLIELLVVIAIIALLMSILMPALSRVKKQAQVVKCQANLRQWGLIFTMYANDNNHKMATPLNRDGWWLVLTRPYTNTMIENGRADDYELYFCPMATKPPAGAGMPVSNASHIYTNDNVVYTASYGFNAWVYDPPAAGNYKDRPGDSMWRTLSVRNAANVPLLTAAFHGGGCPDFRDQPPQFDGAPWANGHHDEMQRFCLNRHQGTVNTLFIDGSLRRVALKELWAPKWHRKYETNGPWTRAGGVAPTDWPEYMRRYRDF